MDKMTFREFCDTCFPHWFRGWTDEQLKAALVIQRSVSQREFCAEHTERGSGKTTLLMAAAMWAVLVHRLEFVAFACWNQVAAEHIAEAVRFELCGNGNLQKRWPDECDESMRMRRDRRCVYCGGVIRFVSVLAVPPLKEMGRHGISVRPDFVIVDDPIDCQAAKSPAKCSIIERNIVELLCAGKPGPLLPGVQFMTPHEVE